MSTIHSRKLTNICAGVHNMVNRVAIFLDFGFFFFKPLLLVPVAVSAPVVLVIFNPKSTR
jgi:hypothetical protein